LLIASLERYSEHPLGRAVLKRAEIEGIEPGEAREVEIHKGQGVSGVVSGHRVFIGNRKLIDNFGVAVPPEFERRADDRERASRTVAFYGWDRQLRGLLVFGDRVKPEAPEAIAALKQRGVKTMIVSGDARQTTGCVAAAVGADDFIAEALPEDKTKVVEKLQRDGLTVAMVGDGVNDAPALAAADLGVALGSGADLAMRAAPVVLMYPSLGRVMEVFELAHRTRRVIAQNLFWAFFYNAAGISLAVAGVLNPILAAGAMVLSSLSVIANSSRLSRGIQERGAAPAESLPAAVQPMSR
jgi:P-type E1-E2 ATPase